MSKLKFSFDPFIIQSGFDEKQFGPGGQVIQSYPKEFMDLKVKGLLLGRVYQLELPWISFLAPEMQTMEGFYPVYLFYKKAKKLILSL